MKLCDYINTNKKIDISKWKSYKIGDLFNVERGKRIVRNRDYVDIKDEINVYPVITPTLQNNGIDGYYSKYNCNGNVIVVGGDVSGMLGFYQENKCWVVDTSRILIPKFNLNKSISLFLLPIIQKYNILFNFQKKANPDDIKKLSIIIPVDNNGNPDWEYMEGFIRDRERGNKENLIKFANNINKKTLFNSKIIKFKEFKISDIFESPKIKKYPKIPKEKGGNAFISCQSTNNGVAAYCNLESQIINAITVSTNGNNFDCFYHDYYFIPSTDVEILFNKNLNKYNAKYICAILNLESKKYSFGKKAKNGKVQNTIIKLPIDHNGNPDWEYMEGFIRDREEEVKKIL